MKKSRLEEIRLAGSEGKATIGEIIEIVADMYLSQNVGNKEIKEILERLETKVDILTGKIDQAVQESSMEPIARMLLTNMEEDNESTVEDFDADQNEAIDNEDE